MDRVTRFDVASQVIIYRALAEIAHEKALEISDKNLGSNKANCLMSEIANNAETLLDSVNRLISYLEGNDADNDNDTEARLIDPDVRHPNYERGD